MMELKMFTPSMTFNTLTNMKAKEEQTFTWILFKATGIGNPNPLRIHLLYRMTLADRLIQFANFWAIAWT